MKEKTADSSNQVLISYPIHISFFSTVFFAVILVAFLQLKWWVKSRCQQCPSFPCSTFNLAYSRKTLHEWSYISIEHARDVVRIHFRTQA